MLSYRHAFHAGNHADVLKHFVLVCLLRHLAQKDKPFWVIDTHAGAGAYGLDAGYAAKNAEFADGIGRLLDKAELPAALADYVDLVRGMNAGGKLSFYPGSPYLAAKLLRPQDRLRLFEMHPTDVDLLGKTFQNDKRVIVTRGDGFAGLRALLPPPPRRALVLIDPSYEDKADYSRVVEAVKDSLKRFPTGTYAIWYPQLARPEARRLPERLRALKDVAWLDASLSVRKPATGEPGMSGSGVFVVNPPWTLAGTLRECLPALKSALALDDNAGFHLETSAETRA
ncbi:MAG: 23S rRNA (adenine(2030)-N(6))-methyltransferase RlmJ [Betaproteobacteria bacterium]|nr:23S rRNA (adenine(2030)-N(6))-methyltransferase RlmJ [Betaproteobacteria bacterium]